MFCTKCGNQMLSSAKFCTHRTHRSYSFKKRAKLQNQGEMAILMKGMLSWLAGVFPIWGIKEMGCNSRQMYVAGGGTNPCVSSQSESEDGIGGLMCIAINVGNRCQTRVHFAPTAGRSKAVNNSRGLYRK